MACEYCHENKDNVYERLDPFDEQVEGKENLVWICDECYRDREREI
jgi:hypothetical protein